MLRSMVSANFRVEVVIRDGRRVLREASPLRDEVRHFVDGHSIGVCHRPMLGFGPLGVRSSLVFVVLFVLARQLLAVFFWTSALSSERGGSIAGLLGCNDSNSLFQSSACNS